MLKKSFIVFVVFFALWNIAAMDSAITTRYTQSDIQINTINADGYIYSNNSYDAVILGSSLAARMPPNLLPGFYNLAFSGMSVYDGGAVLLSLEHLPKVVFIEINAIQKPKDPCFTLEFESSLYSFFKRIFPALRTENQPVILVKKGIAHLKAWTQPAPKPTAKPAVTKTRPAKNSYLSDNMFKSLLAIQIKSYSEQNIDLMDKGIADLKELVARIQARGSRVVFFEMPVNPVIQASPKAALIRLYVAKSFPFYQFPYITLPPFTFKTRDGLHLAEKEAIDYTLYFKQQADLVVQMSGR